MITKFDSLYAGHVDMEEVGYGGIPVNDRTFSDEHLATVFDKAEAIAKPWTAWASTPSGWPSITFNRRGMNVSPTC